MAEYIEREALVHHFMTTKHYLTKDLVMDAAYEISKFPTADVVEVVRCTDEIRKAMDTLNFYRNRYHAEPSNTEEYAVADAINTILPRFYKCLDTARMDGE